MRDTATLIREDRLVSRPELSLAGVAELAGVQRPVASMWRSRFATGSDAFPRPVGRRKGALMFDAREVGQWLTRTRHGNNPDAEADAAASAAPADLDWSESAHVAELEALIALSSHVGGLAATTRLEMLIAARAVDPADELLLSEISTHVARGADWSHFTDALVDAAYSPSRALAITRSRHSATKGADGSAGPLTSAVRDLVADVVATLARRDPVERVVIDRGIDDELAVVLGQRLGEEVALATVPSPAGRAIRRQLRVEGMWAETDADTVTGRTVRVARVPSEPGHTVQQMLTDAESVVLSMEQDDAAVLVGPARALIDALPARARLVRDDVLRSGRLRAAVRLPRGLITAATRDALALWVLGPPIGDVALDQRFTATADLIDSPLTAATREDLISDVIAGMGSAAEVRARTFRFATLTRTASLLARSGSFITRRPTANGPRSSSAATAARLDIAALAAAGDVPDTIRTSSAPSQSVQPAGLPELVAAGHLRLLSGTRIADGLTGGAGLVVVTANDLDEPSSIGARRVDQLAFASAHPSAHLTLPGDVIFRTGPTPAAWVDTEGSKVVAYPARVLRITAADPGGLVPELVAADIPSQPAGPGAWKRWMLRRVAPASIRPLRSALADLDAARTELERRIAALDQYVDTLTAAVAAGAVTLSDPNDAATAAPAPQ
ncbi:hypothetical protein F6J84_14785 [Microbacterium caowuchunii]|uniref:hypothetical protein n=1 Tax=Microbacterium caowuchunii TaxID=2614638 RepID=UPI00124880C6|nr:hypothetical protein [Microbacterium caowuchunii]QEW01235.1 hypothetical protein F6J84_14785 [Microbacterium caowuchunii]